MIAGKWNMTRRMAAGLAMVGGLLGMGGNASAFPIATGGEGLSIIVSGTGDVIATFQGNSGSYSNNLYLIGQPGIIFNNQSSIVGSTVNLGSFAVGTELVFKLDVTTTGDVFFSGPAGGNPDNHAHANVQQNWQPNETLVSFEDLLNGPFNYNDLSFSFTNTTSTNVPEPGTALLAGLGLVMLGVARRRRLAQ